MDARSFTGIGIYTVREASRLAGVPPLRIRRWLRGYSHGPKGERRRSPPVWRAQMKPIDDTVALGFLDLMEIRFVDAFIKAGLSLKKIRQAASLAQDLVGSDHPFSTQKFRTDGKRIFAELKLRPSGDKVLLDLDGQQFGIYGMIAPSLLEGVEFDAEGQAARWHPRQDTPRVVLDPQRQFGQPIVEHGGVQTATLLEAMKAEGSIEAVARWYEIDPEDVRQAVTFELRQAA